MSLFPILFLLGLRFCGVCLLFVRIEESRFKVKSNLLTLQGLGRALETISCSERQLCKRLRIGDRGMLNGGLVGEMRHWSLKMTH